MPPFIRIPTETWQELDGVQEPFSIRQFRGISKLDPMSLDPAYAANLYNLSPANFPAMSVRGGLTRLTRLYVSTRVASIGGRTGLMVEGETTNLLTANQSSVETDLTGFTINASFTGQRDTSTAWHGVASLKITGTSSGRVYAGYVSASVNAGQTYTGSLYVRGSGLGELVLEWYNASSQKIGEVRASFTAGDSWTRVTVTGTAPAGTVTVRMVVFSATAQTFTFWIDGLQLEPVAYPTSWTMGGTTRSPEILTVPSAGVLNPQEGTIEAWICLLRAPGTNIQAIIDGGGTGAKGHFLAVDNVTGTVYFQVGDGSSPIGCFGTTVIQPNTWYHIAATWTASEIAVFVNGVKENTQSVTPSIVFNSLAYVGSHGGTQRWLDGLIGPLRISRRARTDQEIADSYAAGTFRMDSDTTALFDIPNSLVGWSPKGAVYATFMRSSLAYSSSGAEYADSRDSRVVGLGVHKDDVFLAFWGTRARRVSADGTTSGELMTGLTAAPWSFCNFQGNLSGIHLIAANGSSALKFNGSTLSALANAPAGLNYVDTYANRVYGAVGSTLYFSALRKPEDWQTANDAGSIVVETPDGGNITGVKAGPNKLVVFKRYSMFELLGTGPENYSLVPVSDRIGCVSNNSIVTLDGVMRWLGADGIYEYTGGVAPRKDFSLPVQEYVGRVTKGYENRACAGTDGRRYYLALPIDGSPDPNIVLEYDPQFQTWVVWYPTARVLSMAYRQGALYMGLEDGRILKYDPAATTDDGKSIPWVWESPPIGSGSYITRKRWYDMWIVVDLPSGSTLDIYLSPKPDGDDSWTLVRSLTASSDMQSVRIILPVNAIANANWVRVRLEGTGPCKVHELAYRDRVLPLGGV